VAVQRELGLEKGDQSKARRQVKGTGQRGLRVNVALACGKRAEIRELDLLRCDRLGRATVPGDRVRERARRLDFGAVVPEARDRERPGKGVPIDRIAADGDVVEGIRPLLLPSQSDRRESYGLLWFRNASPGMTVR
jgi:hypothetical protein